MRPLHDWDIPMYAMASLSLLRGKRNGMVDGVVGMNAPEHFFRDE